MGEGVKGWEKGRYWILMIRGCSRSRLLKPRRKASGEFSQRSGVKDYPASSRVEENHWTVYSWAVVECIGAHESPIQRPCEIQRSMNVSNRGARTDANPGY